MAYNPSRQGVDQIQNAACELQRLSSELVRTNKARPNSFESEEVRPEGEFKQSLLLPREAEIGAHPDSHLRTLRSQSLGNHR